MSFFVFDLDGTLANCDARVEQYLRGGGRRDWPAFFAACRRDHPIHHVRDVLVALVAAGHRVEIWTGRSDLAEAETRAWLDRHDIDRHLLKRMRGASDHRDDHILKLEWLNEEPERPAAVFEDRARVVAMWRREGVPCFHVAEGNF